MITYHVAAHTETCTTCDLTWDAGHPDPRCPHNSAYENRPRRQPQYNPLAMQIIATALLMGDYEPMKCNQCNGAGQVKTIFFMRRCKQCDGLGLQMIATKTADAFGLEFHPGYARMVPKGEI